MPVLAGVAQYALEARFTGQVHALVSERRHDARRRQVRKPRLVGHAQQRFALLGTEKL